MSVSDPFGGNVEARLEHALGLPPDDAATIFGASVADGSWLAAPATWASRFAMLVWQSGERASVRAVLDAAVRALTTGSLGAVHHAVLLEIFRQRNGVNESQARAIAAWFAAVAEPGDASLAADLLSTVVGSRADLVAACGPVADWLVMHGCSELQARRRLSLSVDVVAIIHQHGDRENLWAAIRCVIDNDEQLGTIFKPYSFDRQPEFLALLAAMDSLVADRLADEHLIVDIARGYGPEDAGVLVAAIAAWTELQSLREAAMCALAGGLLLPAVAERAWHDLVRKCASRSGLRLVDLDAARPAIRALESQTWKQPSPFEAGWTRLVVAELLRFRDELAPSDLDLIERSVGRKGHEAMEHAVRDALRQHVRGRPGDEGILGLLDEQPRASSQVCAAIKLLAAPRATTQPSTESLERSLKDRIEPLLRLRDAIDGVIGAVPQLADCRTLEFVDDLEGGDTVRVEPPYIRMKRGVLLGLLRAGLTDEELVAVGALYVVHEIVHLVQGITAKGDITRLRSTGAETTLMHIDLGADHASAKILATAFPEWKLVWLADLVGRSLAAFPTEAHHTTGARSRKGRRLVGARLDFLARDRGIVTPDLDEYLFGEYGPSGGDMLIMRSGPPLGMVAIGSLSRRDAKRLHEAADRGHIADIDEVLQSVIERLA